MSTKPKRIKLPKSVDIDISAPATPVWDSIKFDGVTETELLAKFKLHYKKHFEFLLGLALSRMAMDTAMINVDAAIKEHANEAIAIRDDDSVKYIDTVFEAGIKTYAGHEAFSFLDEDTRKEVLSVLLSTSKGKPLSSKKSNEPAGYLLGNAYNNITQSIQKIEQYLGNRLGEENTNPYGHQDERPRNSSTRGRKGNKAGVILKTPRSSPRKK